MGSLGDVINVKDGYARNYLIPHGLAVEFNQQNLNVLEEKKKKNELGLKKKKEEALVLAQKLGTVSCTIAVKVIDDDRLFGSVTNEIIQKALEAEGVMVDKRDIQLQEPIKKLGVYSVPVKLHPEIAVNCKIWIVKE